MATVFFSYSHADESLRDELQKHLAMLTRQRVIEMWHDRRITAGQPLDREITAALEAADVILLLVSPDFLASDYCYDIEVRRAMERHERGEAIVIPVILRPCDWHSAPFGRLLAVPRDGKAVTTWSNRDEAFLDIARAIRDAVAQRPSRSQPPPARSDKAHRTILRPHARSSNLRLPHTFSDREKDDFLEQAIAYIAGFFENSLAALSDQNPAIETKFRKLDALRFVALAYRSGRVAARCTIWMATRNSFVSGIGYSENDSGSTSGFNESLSVEADDEGLYLKPLGLTQITRPQPESKLSIEQAAEFLWNMFTERLRQHP